MNDISMIASLLSAGIFLGGSAAGVVGVLASEAGIAARAAEAAAVAAARAAQEAERAAAEVAKMTGQAAAAGKLASQFEGAGRVTNALGAGLWTTASTFTMVSAGLFLRHMITLQDIG